MGVLPPGPAAAAAASADVASRCSTRAMALRRETRRDGRTRCTECEGQHWGAALGGSTGGQHWGAAQASTAARCVGCMTDRDGAA
jgi:hypothetical protein